MHQKDLNRNSKTLIQLDFLKNSLFLSLSEVYASCLTFLIGWWTALSNK